MNHSRSKSTLAAILAFTAILAGLFTIVGTAKASAYPQVSSCGANAYVERIDTVPAADPDYKIVLTPTQSARAALGNRDATVSMWHQIQACVPGLYGRLADSIWQQLECHQWGGLAEFATGPTFDFETWREPLDNPNPVSYVATHCLNKQTDGASENGTPGLGSNFPGYLDLHPGHVA